VPAIRAVGRVLARRAAAAPPGSAEAAEIEILAARLRQEYAEAHRRRTESS
jgi:hypothetical protein